VLTQVALLDAVGEPLTSDYPAYTTGQVMLESADRLVAEENEHVSGITSAFVAWHLDRNLRFLAHVER